MIVASILFCLSSFALATTMIATRIKLSQAWGQTNTQMAWAVGVAAAPTLVGLLLLPVFLLGLWSPLACLLLPFVLVVIIGWNGLLSNEAGNGCIFQCIILHDRH